MLIRDSGSGRGNDVGMSTKFKQNAGMVTAPSLSKMPVITGAPMTRWPRMTQIKSVEKQSAGETSLVALSPVYNAAHIVTSLPNALMHKSEKATT